MNSSQIIKKALLSEKAYQLMEKGIYTFLVDKNVNKKEIADAVENQFGVKVKKVNLSNFAPKTKRIPKTRKTVKVGGGKKAIVALKPGESIAILSPKTKGKKEKNKDAKNEKDKKGK